jgi:hypothetical protein
LWSFCSTRPPGAPPIIPLSRQLINLARWLRGARPPASEAALEARVVRAIGAELAEELADGSGGEP